MVRFLAAEGANVEAADAEGHKVLQIACDVAERGLYHFTGYYGNSPVPTSNDVAFSFILNETLQDLVAKTSVVTLQSIRVGRSSWPLRLLQFFITWGFEELVEPLLSRGVDVNVVDDLGYIPLIRAARKQKHTILQLLIDWGADVNGKDQEGCTALGHVLERNPRFPFLFLRPRVSKQLRRFSAVTVHRCEGCECSGSFALSYEAVQREAILLHQGSR
uniref:Uncharacterized protein n=1 Tax=Chromera velia CCMP2878 TaxID=1169474 RepID=A0A0G4HA73_9ALVE|mmetsp:Transcript_39685/g.78151  ORF Transcript_39685/g.78151 Transcript_39685/m.78151 type:complete len:218 (-) Transcript_39685:111-764(-)|eukprot:Cvel_25454.t1-p1 / transcript=Cvel_25454.t1 / gene=Cvel_25454 / organism=Chromera_velia_CCMP2878 / gene_product=26S proteasome non-ATPase regulatory subunit 10, putative / transcript_product=26S proteasome non-ATPase regulatory subunit 10, putative / location=Cvel_scaffold2887:816-1466(-) / protein_length=217 / sequence_SO=supercontig / SO=protein_coding / is_pseudo=false